MSNPEQYIRQAATGTTGFLPVQFYRALAQMSHEDLLEFVTGIATRSPAKKKLLERKAYYNQLTGGLLDGVMFATASNAQYFLDAIKSLNDEQIQANVDKLLSLMKSTFDEHYSSSAKVADALRRAACRVDSAMIAAA